MKSGLIFTGLFMSALLFSCSSGEAETQHSTSDVVEEQIPVKDPVKLPMTVAGPQYWTGTDTVLQTKVLMTGVFHGDEVESNLEQKEWCALTVNLEGVYELNYVELIVKRENDPILDEEDEKTGWNISIEETDPLALFAGSLREGPVTAVSLTKNQLLPGDTITFQFQGSEYQIFATGNYEENTEDWFAIDSYRLFITGEKNGEQITQLLVEHENMDDAMPIIQFIGDLDRDGFPDILMENTRHYNVSNPTLYLSGNTESGKLLEISGWLWTTGC